MSLLIADILKEIGWVEHNLYQPIEKKELKEEYDYYNPRENTSPPTSTNQSLSLQQEPFFVSPKPYPKNMTLIV